MCFSNLNQVEESMSNLNLRKKLLAFSLLTIASFSKIDIFLKHLNFKRLYLQNWIDFDLCFDFVEKKNILPTKCSEFGRAFVTRLCKKTSSAFYKSSLRDWSPMIIKELVPWHATVIQLLWRQNFGTFWGQYLLGANTSLSVGGLIV